MGTGLSVSVKRGRTYASAEIETLTDDELHDLLRRASPAQARAYCIWREDTGDFYLLRAGNP